MQLLIVRHAIAEDRLEFASSEKNDDLRPLTPQGRKRMRRGARGLRALVPTIDVLAASPLVRAEQTAGILAEVYGRPTLVRVPALAPGAGAEEAARWLATQPDAATVLVVGHEPDLSELIGWLTSGTAQSYIDFKKGGACLLHCPAPPSAGACRMQWLADPKSLRLLGSA